MLARLERDRTKRVIHAQEWGLHAVDGSGPAREQHVAHGDERSKAALVVEGFGDREDFLTWRGSVTSESDEVECAVGRLPIPKVIRILLR